MLREVFTSSTWSTFYNSFSLLLSLSHPWFNLKYSNECLFHRCLLLEFLFDLMNMFAWRSSTQNFICISYYLLSFLIQTVHFHFSILTYIVAAVLWTPLMVNCILCDDSKIDWALHKAHILNKKNLINSNIYSLCCEHVLDWFLSPVMSKDEMLEEKTAY